MINTPEQLNAIKVLADYFKPAFAQQQAASPAVKQYEFVDEWMEANFYIPETEYLIKLQDFQRIVLRLMFHDERYNPATCIWSQSKKAGKTAITGGIGRWAAETWGKYNEIINLASDEEQARGRIYAALVQSIQLNPNFVARGDGGELPGQWRIIKNKATHIPTGTTVTAVPSNYRGQAGSNPTLSLWCVSEDTEILTKRGFVKSIDLQMDDEIANLDPSTNKVIYAKPRAINKTPYSGPMIRFNHRRVEFLVTPNHRVWGNYTTHSSRKSAITGWQFAEAEHLANGMFYKGWIKSDSSGLVDSKDEISVEDARLLGYYIAEGNISYYEYKGSKTPASVYISQSAEKNPDTHSNIAVTAVACGYDPRPRTQGWEINSKELAARYNEYGNSFNKFIPHSILYGSYEVQKAFFDAYIEGDGSPVSLGYVCSTVSQKLADNLMQLAMHIGYVPRLMSEEILNYVGSKVGPHPLYRLSFSIGPIAWERGGGHWSKEYYNGTVVCPATDTGIFYIRYNGKCCWTGNTELWSYTSENHMRLWSEMTPSPVRPRSMRFVETYAGYVNESKLLWSLWQDATNPKNGAIQLTRDDVPNWPTHYPKQDGTVMIDDSFKLPLYWNPIARLFGFIDTGPLCHKMPWQTDEYYRTEAHDLKDPLQYDRLHNNWWVSSVSAFMPINWYDRAIISAEEAIVWPLNTPVVLAVDAAVSGDCCAVGGFSLHPTIPDTVVLRGGGLSEIWYPPADGSDFDYADNIEPSIRNSCATQNVVCCCYDPYQMHDLMTRLMHEALTWFNEFSQMNPRTESDKQLYDTFMGKRILIEADVPADFREHFENADKHQSITEDTKLRIVKRSDEAKIDGVIVCSMGVHQTLYLNLE